MSLINAGAVLGGREAADIKAQIAAKLSTTDAPATVRGTALTGLSTATATPVTAADTVLAAAGKLQRQATDNAVLLPPFFDTSWYKTGLLYDAVYPYYAGLTSVGRTLGTLTLNKRKILDDVTFNEILLNVTSVAAAGTIFYGVYSSDANGRPSTLLASGSASTATTGVKSTSISLALTKGQVVWDAYLNTGEQANTTTVEPLFSDGSVSATATGAVLFVKDNQTSLPVNINTGGAPIAAISTRIQRILLRAA